MIAVCNEHAVQKTFCHPVSSLSEILWERLNNLMTGGLPDGQLAKSPQHDSKLSATTRCFRLWLEFRQIRSLRWGAEQNNINVPMFQLLRTSVVTDLSRTAYVTVHSHMVILWFPCGRRMERRANRLFSAVRIYK